VTPDHTGPADGARPPSGTRPLEPGRLRSYTLALPEGPPIDPLAVAAGGCLVASPTLILAGRDMVAAFDLPGGLDELGASDGATEATSWLASVHHEDAVGRHGSRPAAFGALPFDSHAAARLMVPAVTYGRDETGEWAVVVSEGGGPPDPAALRAGLCALRRPDAASGSGSEIAGASERVEVRALPSPKGYEAMVAEAVAAIADRRLAKVVLARCVDVRLATTPDPVAVLDRLHAQEPSCTAFCMPSGAGWFLGVTPELLVARGGRVVRAHPLAGTVGLGLPGSDDDAVTGLLSSPKNRAEHSMVVEDVVEILGPRCATLDVPAQPSAVRLRSVAHLGTEVAGTLRADDPVLSLVAALHPTPAVGGAPRAEALAFIEAAEPVGRGCWAGPVGWADGAGDGDWWIGIRSLSLGSGGARIHAGAGVVAGSVPSAELAETTIKLTPVLEALAPAAARSGAGSDR